MLKQVSFSLYIRLYEEFFAVSHDLIQAAAI